MCRSFFSGSGCVFVFGKISLFQDPDAILLLECVDLSFQDRDAILFLECVDLSFQDRDVCLFLQRFGISLLLPSGSVYDFQFVILIWFKKFNCNLKHHRKTPAAVCRESGVMYSSAGSVSFKVGPFYRCGNMTRFLFSEISWPGSVGWIIRLYGHHRLRFESLSIMWR